MGAGCRHNDYMTGNPTKETVMVDKQDNPYPIGTRVRVPSEFGGYYSGTVVGCWWREGGTREGSHGWSYQVTTDEPKVIHGAEHLRLLYDAELAERLAERLSVK